MAEKAEGGEGDAEGVVKEGPEKILFDCAEGSAGETERFGDRFEVGFQEDDIGGFAGDIGGVQEGDSEVGLFEGRGVIDAVTGEGDALAGLLQRADDFNFAFRADFGANVGGGDANLGGDRFGGGTIVAGDEVDPFA